MPQPLVPPPAGDTGALTFPRRLQRWLDQNPVTRLTRTSTFITVPSFAQNVSTWNGYSDIIFTFNFLSPNNISFLPFTVAFNANYVACVAFQNGSGVTRYLLWNAAGSNMNMDLVPYSGQYLSKNFRIEIWNTSQGAVSDTRGFTITTSKLNPIDYRYAVDTPLATPTENIEFYAIANPATLIPVTGLLLDYDASTGINQNTWAAKINNTGYNGYNTLISGQQFQQNTDDFRIHYLPYASGGSLAYTPAIPSGNALDPFLVSVFIVFRNNTFSNSQPAQVSNPVTLSNGVGGANDASLGQYTTDGGTGESSGQIKIVSNQINQGQISPTVASGTDWLIGCFQVTQTGAIGSVHETITPPTGTLDMGGSFTVNWPLQTLQINNNFGNNVSIAEILVYGITVQVLPVLNYLYSKYCPLFPLPLMFNNIQPNPPTPPANYGLATESNSILTTESGTNIIP